MSKKAIILGASGLVGSYLLNLLLNSEHYTKVVVLVRKPLPIQNHKIIQYITDFKDLDSLKSLIEANVIFSCLGSTKAKTPDIKDYTYIDKTIPERIAIFAAENNVEQFHLISALGANPNSFVFYNRMKGETEEVIKKINIPGIFIYQPSLIKGPRKEKRPGESIMVKLSKAIDLILIGGLKKYRSIAYSDIAKAMYNQSLRNDKGIFTFPSDKIKELS